MTCDPHWLAGSDVFLAWGGGGGSELPDGSDLWPPFSVWLAGSDVFLVGGGEGVQSYLTALTCDPHYLCDWQAVRCFWPGGGVQSYLTALTCDPHFLCDWQAVMCFWTGGFRATWRRWPVTPILCVTGRQWCVSGRGGSELPDCSTQTLLQQALLLGQDRPEGGYRRRRFLLRPVGGLYDAPSMQCDFSLNYIHVVSRCRLSPYIKSLVVHAINLMILTTWCIVA